MFGLGKGGDKAPVLTGAKEKLERARMARGGGPAEGEKKGKRTHPAVAIIAIYVMSVASAYTVAQNVRGGLNLHTGFTGLDNLLFGSSTPNYTGNGDIDTGILMLIRGGFFCLAAGVLPFFSLLWQRLVDNAHMNPYRVFWGFPIGFIFAVLTFKFYVWPLLVSVYEVFG